MADQFTQLGKFTKIVADTGDVAAFGIFKPTDATTNPSLILAAAKLPQYQYLVDDAVEYGKAFAGNGQLERSVHRVCVNFGGEISKLVPGVVSTEVDARLSFKPGRTVDKARRLLSMYAEKGIDINRILIKVAATWPGIKAAELLERENIRCNLTLIFDQDSQARACAEAGVHLISPFVGRITDWYKKDRKVSGFKTEEDPGVLSVRSIYAYYKKYGYKTIVMGASFRNKDQVVGLAGCDNLTIGPKFLDEMKKCTDPVVRKLSPPASVDKNRPLPLDDRHFYFALNANPMATEKLADGIRGFVRDQIILEDMLKAKILAKYPSTKL